MCQCKTCTLYRGLIRCILFIVVFLLNPSLSLSLSLPCAFFSGCNVVLSVWGWMGDRLEARTDCPSTGYKSVAEYGKKKF